MRVVFALSVLVAGCEAPGIDVFHADGTYVDLVRTGDEWLPEVRVCPGEQQKIVATLYSGCGSICYEESRITSLTTEPSSLTVMPAELPDSTDDHLRLGHALLITADADGLVQMELESLGADGGWRETTTISVTLDEGACP
jgi:hypothetical protein